jgi:hypothetical protein
MFTSDVKDYFCLHRITFQTRVQSASDPKSFNVRPHLKWQDLSVEMHQEGYLSVKSSDFIPKGFVTCTLRLILLWLTSQR